MPDDFKAGEKTPRPLLVWLAGRSDKRTELAFLDERWKSKGERDTATRAGEIWRQTLEEYEQPPIDDAIREELAEYVTRRRAELGD